MISEESAQRIAAALERLAAVLERQHPQPAPAPVFPATPPYSPVSPFSPVMCLNCGGNHGGLMCPLLAPTTTGTRAT